jgi:hypothetical protein
MKPIKRWSPLGIVVVMALLAGLTFFCFCSGAQARDGGGFIAGGTWGGGFQGGGFYGGGGFSGGSFRAGGGWALGPRHGGALVGRPPGIYGRTPLYGEFYRGPYGGGAFQGPFGGEAVRGPKVVTGPKEGEVATGVRGKTFRGERGFSGGAHMVTVPGSWGPYYGPTWNPAPAGTGVQVPVGTVGTIYNTLPPGAVPKMVGGTRYYYNAGIYYLPCYQGTELAYCVVPDPTQ